MAFSSLFKNKTKENVFCSAIVLGAGQGTRMKSDVRKQFIEVAGKPVIVYALEAFEECDEVDEVVLVVAQNDIVYAQEIVKAFGLHKVTKIVSGGLRRQDSVFCGLQEVSQKADVVAVHDGARPLIRSSEISKVIRDGMKSGAATLGVKVKDTIKMADTEGKVLSTLDRSCLYQIQTPQVFRKDILLDGYVNAERGNLEFTDDASLVEAMNVPVQITEGRYDNIKITTPEDLIYLEAFVESIEN